MTPPLALPASVRARAWLHPDGWIEVHLSTEDIPPSFKHRTTLLPKIRLQIDGGSAQYLNPLGLFEQKEPQ